jgi:hypothetical protein
MSTKPAPVASTAAMLMDRAWNRTPYPTKTTFDVADLASRLHRLAKGIRQTGLYLSEREDGSIGHIPISRDEAHIARLNTILDAYAIEAFRDGFDLWLRSTDNDAPLDGLQPVQKCQWRIE